ncbi:MAG: glycine cleavage system protein H [Sphingobacteriales bacterium 46-32]|nr:MAG: glycine cleavage system protein H [Sphingobacteriales bacterium 46-32]
MQFPNDYKYSKEHTWAKIENEAAIIGITEFAQSELGEIVYVDLPAIGKKFTKDEVFGSVEAVKTTSDLFIPVSGEITEINTALKDKADLVNSNPYTDGWMIKVRLSNPSESNMLLTSDDYQKMVGAD